MVKNFNDFVFYSLGIVSTLDIVVVAAAAALPLTIDFLDAQWSIRDARYVKYWVCYAHTTVYIRVYTSPTIRLRFVSVTRTYKIAL